MITPTILNSSNLNQNYGRDEFGVYLLGLFQQCRLHLHLYRRVDELTSGSLSMKKVASFGKIHLFSK